jgi:hypothetical protein
MRKIHESLGYFQKRKSPSLRTSIERVSLQAPLVGFEPTTVGLEVRCSIHLSYRGTGNYFAAHYSTE